MTAWCKRLLALTAFFPKEKVMRLQILEVSAGMVKCHVSMALKVIFWATNFLPLP